MQGNQRLALALAPLLLADFDWHLSQNDVPDDLDPDSRSSRHIVSVALPPGGPLSRPVAVKGKAKPEEQKSKMSYLSRSALSEKGCCPFRD